MIINKITTISFILSSNTNRSLIELTVSYSSMQIIKIFVDVNNTILNSYIPTTNEPETLHNISILGISDRKTVL